MELNQLDDSRREYYKAIIGQKNQDYYLTKFSHFDSNGKVSVSWHWPAFFVTFFWLLYRKMWTDAFLYVFFAFCLGKMIDIVTADNSTAIVIGFIFYNLALLFVPTMYANAIYYYHCNEKIKETSVSAQDSENLLKELYVKGGVSKKAFIFALVVLLFILAILLAIAIPAYQDYLMRTSNP